ncbi:MAG: PA14 domain-containing protein [bacterium]
MHKYLPLLLALAPLAGCIEDNAEPKGLRPTSSNGGVEVIFDLDARPLPEVPFPNDIATIVDPTSPTGKRLNVSLLGATKLESIIREKANRLDGFGTYAPITVQFTGLLDLRNILNRHVGPAPDFSDDAVYVVNIDPKSDEYGKFEYLDLGNGNFPATMKDPTKYFDFDPRRNGSNFLYESVQEVDSNLNGVLDPEEDTDDDDVWDSPNTLDPGADPLEWRQLLEFYERETNTLIIRTVDALQPATRYAVVLTSALVDADGNPVNSPFGYINHTRQTDDLSVLRDILPKNLPNRFDPKLEDVRFAWSFTTQSSTLELETIRAGLYGHGTMAWLKEQFPAELTMIHRIKGRDVAGESALITRLPQIALQFIFDVLAGGLSPQGKAKFLESYDYVDYIVSGSMRVPYFLVDKDGDLGTPEEIAQNRNQFDDDESFDVDVSTGRAAVGTDELTFWCTIPKATEGRKPPFPVVIYGHGYGSARPEFLGFASANARLGLASCGLDAAGHGLVLPEDVELEGAISNVIDRANLTNLVDVLTHSRARDLNNDGRADSGGDFWTADIFHTRDILRQTVVDHMQFIRMLRSWDGVKRFPDAVDENDPFVGARRSIVAGFDADGDGKGELAGDFTGDGIVDLGGEQPYYAWGISLGGIVSPLLAGIEPAVRASSPNSGGAGLLEIGYRSTQGGVPEAVILPLIGPGLIGRGEQIWNADTGVWEFNGTMHLEWLMTSVNSSKYLRFATIDGIENGDRIVLRNLERERRPQLVEPKTLTSHTIVRGGNFRTAIGSSAASATDRQRLLAFEPTFDSAAALTRLETAKPGLTASYFRQTGGRIYPAFSKVVPTLDATFADAPGAGFNADSFLVRHEGVITAEATANYTFKVIVDGNAELRINNVRVANGRDGEFTGKAKLEAGVPASIQVNFTQETAPGSLSVLWSADGIAEAVIPESALATHVDLTADERAEYEKHLITARGGDARTYGDPIVIEIRSATGELKETIDTFGMDTVFENVVYPAGTALAALRDGYGLKRQTPEMRRFLGLAQHLVDAADPAVYGHTYFKRPLQFPYETNPNFRDGATNVFFVPTAGDSAVPVATGYAMARIAGVLDYQNIDPRYGMSENQYLIENYVYEGIYWLDRFPDYPGTLFDQDDLDGGKFTTDRFPERGSDPNADAENPVRATVQTARGISALRVPYQDVQGNHGIFLPEPTLTFDIDGFMSNQISYFFAHGGEKFTDDPCMADFSLESCAWYDRDTWQRPVVE